MKKSISSKKEVKKEVFSSIHLFLALDTLTLMLKFLLPLLLVLSQSSLFAQDASIVGVVETLEKEPVAFANVILLDAEGTVLQGTVTEEDGTYSLSNLALATYTLKISFVGFKEVTLPPFTLSRKQTVLNVTLEEDLATLDEVTITAKSPIITRKADRLIFNVENTIVSEGTTSEILQRTPGIISSQGNLLVRNKDAVVYINDRKVQLSSEELVDLLDNLPGNTIKEVEVIANPPANYEAEGAAVINIKTSRAVAPGYKGNLNARATYAVFPKYAFGTSHYVKNDRLNLFFNYTYSPAKQTLRTTNFINYQDETGPISSWMLDYERKWWTDTHSANLILDYNLTERQTLGVTVSGFYSPDRFDYVRSQTDVNSFVGDDFEINTSSRFDADRSNIAADLNYGIDLENGRLSVNGHYTNYNRDRTQDLTSRYINANAILFQTIAFATAAIQDIEIYTGQLDYQVNWGNVAVEMGGKASIIDSQSQLAFFDVMDSGSSGLNQAQSDNFLYDEEVYAGYLSFEREWEKWAAKAGLRAEQTYSTGTSLVQSTITELDYLEWFPSAYLAYQASDNHRFALNYDRKLYRPKYQDLNPFAFFLNENNFNQGNPNLVPSFSNNFSVDYTWKGEWDFSFYYNDNGANISTLVFQDNDNQVLRTERQNVLESTSYGFDFRNGRYILNGWFMVTYISVFHEDETFLARESGNAVVTNEIDGLYMSFDNYINLSDDRTLSATLGFEYFSGFIFGSYQQSESLNATFGLRKSLWNRRAVITAQVNDIFGEANAPYRSTYLNQDNGYFSLPETQYFRVGFTYNFGNFRLRDNNRGISKSERDRITTGDDN